MTFPGEDHPSDSHLFSLAYSSLYKVEAYGTFSNPCWHLHWCHFSSAHFLDSLLVRLYGHKKKNGKKEISYHTGKLTFKTITTAMH